MEKKLKKEIFDYRLINFVVSSSLLLFVYFLDIVKCSVFEIVLIVVLYFISLIFSPYLVVCFKKGKKILSGISGIVSPGFLILSNAFKQNDNSVIKIMLISLGITLAIYLLIGLVKIYKIKNKNKKIREILKSTQIVCTIICIFAVLLAYPTINQMNKRSNNFLENLLDTDVIVSEIKPSNNVKTKEDSYIKAYIKELAPLIDGSYENLSIEQKLDICQIVCNIESTFNGSSVAVPVKLTSLKSDEDGCTYACFINTMETIYLNSEVFNELSAEDALYVLLHECYHSYQYEQVKLYNSVSDEYKNLSMFYETKKYAEGFENYIDGPDNFEDYQNQYLEKTAEAYAYSESKTYLELLDQYVNSENFK